MSLESLRAAVKEQVKLHRICVEVVSSAGYLGIVLVDGNLIYFISKSFTKLFCYLFLCYPSHYWSAHARSCDANIIVFQTIIRIIVKRVGNEAFQTSSFP